MAIALIIASRLAFASPIARDLHGRQDTSTGELETGTGGLECKPEQYGKVLLRLILPSSNQRS